MLRRHFLRAALGAAALLGLAPLASADVIVAYDTFGVPGDTPTLAPTTEAFGIDGLNIIRGAGLTPSAASNSFSSSGFDDLSDTDFVQLGFNVASGGPILVESIRLGTRSSATGPGFIDVLASVDGGEFFTLDTLVQPSAAFINPIVSIGETVATSLVIRFVAANGTSADGGTIGAFGTFRIGDYLNPQGVFEDIIIEGRTVNVIPEPSSMALCATGLVALTASAAARRRRAV